MMTNCNGWSCCQRDRYVNRLLDWLLLNYPALTLRTPSSSLPPSLILPSPLQEMKGFVAVVLPPNPECLSFGQ